MKAKNKHVKIPIIILNWNGWRDTQECIAAVLQQSYQDFIIYLVDNGSVDGSREQFESNYSNNKRIKLIFNEENQGFTKGNNHILTTHILPNSEYQYVILLNNDTAPTVDWLKNLISSSMLDKAGMIASRMVDYYDREKMDNAGHLMLNTGEILPIGHGKSIEKYNQGFENMGASAGAALYSVKMLKDIGIFDEHFNTGYEDAELGVRAIVSGYTCWYEPTAVVYHKMGQSIKKIFDYKYSLMIQKNILYSYFKLMPILLIFISIPFIIIKYVMMLLVGLLFWRFSYIRILIRAIKEAIWDNFKITIKARSVFFKRNYHLPSLAILKKLTFFLWFDIVRFYKYFIQNKLSSFETYGKIRETIHDK